MPTVAAGRTQRFTPDALVVETCSLLMADSCPADDAGLAQVHLIAVQAQLVVAAHL